MEEITFNDLPQAVAKLLEKVERLEVLMQSLVKPSKTEGKTEEDRWLNIKDLCDYLPNHPNRGTIYKWINQRVVPCYKKGNRIYFKKSEIDNWISEGYCKTVEDIDREAMQYIITHPKKW